MPLACLRSLKLRHTLISEDSVSHVISRCHALTRLDVSFTPIRKLMVPSDKETSLALKKLSLTSTPLTSSFLRAFAFSQTSEIFTSLHTLHIGALGASPSSSVSSLTDSLTLTDQILGSLTNILTECRALENVSLVGNAKLGVQSSADMGLGYFVRRVGRRCKVGTIFAYIISVTVMLMLCLRSLISQVFLDSGLLIFPEFSLCMSGVRSPARRRIQQPMRLRPSIH
jgi:hypothetical protein